MKSVHNHINSIEHKVWSEIPDKQMRHDVWMKTWKILEGFDTDMINEILSDT